MILMGIVNLPSIKDYWRNDEAFNNRPLANRISCTRFLQIHRFLHLVDNDSLLSHGEPGYSKIQKVKPILTQLSANCKEQFIPGRDLSVDEAMVKFNSLTTRVADLQLFVTCAKQPELQICNFFTINT